MLFSPKYFDDFALSCSKGKFSSLLCNFFFNGLRFLRQNESDALGLQKVKLGIPFLSCRCSFAVILCVEENRPFTDDLLTWSSNNRCPIDFKFHVFQYSESIQYQLWYIWED